MAIMGTGVLHYVESEIVTSKRFYISVNALGKMNAGTESARLCGVQTIKYSEKAKCPKCGGMLAYDARMQDSLPYGLGFAPGETRFSIERLERKGWRGECMECGAKVFAVISQRIVKTYPRSINRKIAAAQAAA